MPIEHARACLELEADAIRALIPRINDQFAAAMAMVLNCTGRVVVTGMGKSGLIGKKIAATLASTGTPAFFLHPAEGIHGDLGMVTAGDIILAISNSGETNEIISILPTLKRIGAPIIAMTGREQSTLVQNSDVFLNVAVEKEACPLGLAPTASTTAALAMGDALAVALLSARKFTPEEFALYHPGGALGRKLLLTVENVMHSGEDMPVISPDKTVK
ncbi:MAG: kdsD, partial [Sporomusa sp.]|nr:kdsD [Sporomusa sp.]